MTTRPAHPAGIPDRPAASDHVPAGPWRLTAPLLGASLLALVAAHWATVHSMVETWWRSETFAHGFLVVPVVAVLIWSRRRALASVRPVPFPWGLAIVAGLSLVWLMAWAANVLGVQQVSIVLMIPALVLTIAGPGVVRVLAFPLGYLLFAAPVGEVLVPALTEFTARFTVAALRLVGVPVSETGLYLNVPGATWEVSKACSGIRYLIASVALGTLYAYVNYRRWGLRLAFVGLSIVVPILANGARAFMIVMIAYLTDGRLAMGIDHILYGWIFFAIVTLLLFWFGSRWREGDPPAATASPHASPAPAGEGSSGRPAAVFAIAMAVLVAAPGVATRLGAEDAAGPAIGSLAPPPAPGWSGPFETADDWRPQFESPAGERRAAYVRGSEQVQFYTAVYGRQRQGAELISSMNRVYDRDGWRRVGERAREVTVDGRTLRVIETDLLHSQAGGARRRTAWHWYVVSGEPTTDPYVAKLLEAKARLTGGWDGAAVVALAAEERSRPGAAELVLTDFVRAHAAALRRTARPDGAATP